MSDITYSTKLDWLSCTFSSSPVYPEKWPAKWVETRAFHGYDMARKSTDGRIEMMRTDRPKMGYHVQLSGATLDTLRQWSTDKEIAAWAQTARKASRVDVAIDARGLKVDVLKILKAYEDGTMRTRVRKAPKIYKHGRKEGQGIYIGNRGATHVVIYDKAEQLALKDEDWTRVEFRANEDRSQQVLAAIVSGSDVRPIVNSWVSLPKEPWWIDMMSKAITPLEPVPAPDGDTVKWLLKTAAPTLGREMALDDDLLMRFLEVAYAIKEEQINNDRNTA